MCAGGHAADQRPLERDARGQHGHAVHRVAGRKGDQQADHTRVRRRAQQERLPVGVAAQQVLRTARVERGQTAGPFSMHAARARGGVRRRRGA